MKEIRYKLVVTKIEPRDEESKTKMVATIAEQNKNRTRGYDNYEKTPEQIVMENDFIGIETSRVLDIDVTADEWNRIKAAVIKESK